MTDKVNVGLIGYGKMGKMIESIAAKHAVSVLTYFDIDDVFHISDLVREKITNIDVLLDFSVADAVLDNVKNAAHYGKKLVIGTTGWYDKMEKIREFVQQNKSGVIYGTNFSLGVNLLFKISEYAGRLFSAFDDYDVYIEEAHHKMKKDAPSGTALSLHRLLQKNYKDTVIPVKSVRAGYIPGTHAIKFDSAVDSVTVEHVARNRIGFSEGALMAARWIVDKTGFYEFQDVLDDILNRKR
jgi:4-hydroxy-tetrahydrodipicolinate reductase